MIIKTKDMKKIEERELTVFIEGRKTKFAQNTFFYIFRVIKSHNQDLVWLPLSWTTVSTQRRVDYTTLKHLIGNFLLFILIVNPIICYTSLFSTFFFTYFPLTLQSILHAAFKCVSLETLSLLTKVKPSSGVNIKE